MNIQEIQDLILEAFDWDFEMGSHWMAEAHAADFKKNYPKIADALRIILDIEEKT